MRYGTRRIVSHFLALLALCVGSLGLSGAAFSQVREEARLALATQVLDEQRGQRDNVIPDKLLERAYGIAVIPDVITAALVVGGRRGSGVMVVRDKQGRFSNPIFVDLTGGSVGWQIGAQSTDVVLVFANKRGIEGIADGKLTLGAGASVAAGPLGRRGEAAAGVNAEVYSYSRNRGLFAGVALDGTAVTISNRANAAYYRKRGISATDIMDGTVTSNSESTKRFLAAIAASTGEGGAAAAASPGTSDAQAPPPAGGGVQTFPVEDPKPGAQPPP